MTPHEATEVLKRLAELKRMYVEDDAEWNLRRIDLGSEAMHVDWHALAEAMEVVTVKAIMELRWAQWRGEAAARAVGPWSLDPYRDCPYDTPMFRRFWIDAAQHRQNYDILWQVVGQRNELSLQLAAATAEIARLKNFEQQYNEILAWCRENHNGYGNPDGEPPATPLEAIKELSDDAAKFDEAWAQMYTEAQAEIARLRARVGELERAGEQYETWSVRVTDCVGDVRYRDLSRGTTREHVELRAKRLRDNEGLDAQPVRICVTAREIAESEGGDA